MLSYFTKMQLIKMQLMHDMESKVPNASATLEKKMLLYAYSFTVSCHSDCNQFWHTHLRAVGQGNNSSTWINRNPSAACSCPCRQSATRATVDIDGSCCRCRRRQVLICSLALSSSSVDSIAVCPAESSSGYRYLSARRPRVWWKAGLPLSLFLLIYVSQEEKT